MFGRWHLGPFIKHTVLLSSKIIDLLRGYLNISTSQYETKDMQVYIESHKNIHWLCAKIISGRNRPTSVALKTKYQCIRCIHVCYLSMTCIKIYEYVKDIVPSECKETSEFFSITQKTKHHWHSQILMKKTLKWLMDADSVCRKIMNDALTT